MLREEGLPNVFLRHKRLAEATRRAVRAWDLEIWAANPDEYSSSTTAVLLPEGVNEAAFRAVVLDRFNMSLGRGPRKGRGQGFSHRPPGRSQRAHAGGHAGRRRNGTGDRGNSPSQRAESAPLSTTSPRRESSDAPAQSLAAARRHGARHGGAVEHAIWLDAVRQPHARRDPLGDGGNPVCVQHSDFPEHVAGAAGGLGCGPCRPALCGDVGRRRGRQLRG